MRTILHSDCNNFYASVEMVYDPALRGRPLAICGDPDMRHGIVLAKNEQAKRLGVFTGQVVWQAKMLCPNLHVIIPNHRRYLRFSRMMRSVYHAYTDRVEPYGLDESWLDVTGDAKTGVEIANELRARAKEELGITVSVGVSFNKVFAKLASDLKKPDATTLVDINNYRDKVWPLPVSALLFVGRATCDKLMHNGIYTIGALARSDAQTVRHLFGKGGDMLRMYARGEDDSPVLRAFEEDPLQSIGNSTTPPHDIANEEEAKVILCLLSESVATRLRAHGFVCGTVVLWLRDCKLNSFERQMPLDAPSDLAYDIYAASLALLRACYGKWPSPLRSLGVRGVQLTPASCDRQQTLFPDVSYLRRRELETTLDSLRGRFGHGSVQRGVMLRDRTVPITEPVADHALQPLAAMHGRNA